MKKINLFFHVGYYIAFHLFLFLDSRVPPRIVICNPIVTIVSCFGIASGEGHARIENQAF